MKRIQKKTKSLRLHLQENLERLGEAWKILDYSYCKCRKIGIKKSYTPGQLESFEALTSRFARVADIMTQKVMKSIFILLAEDPMTFIDMANLAERVGVIDRADFLLEIRELRNEVAHEYSSRDMIELFRDCLEYTPKLKKTIFKVQSYAENLLRKS